MILSRLATQGEVLGIGNAGPVFDTKDTVTITLTMPEARALLLALHSGGDWLTTPSPCELAQRLRALRIMELP